MRPIRVQTRRAPTGIGAPFNRLTAIEFVITEALNREPCGLSIVVGLHLAPKDATTMARKSKYVTDEMVGVIKLARARGIFYEQIASYYVINQGRIADVMKGRIGPDIPPAMTLPGDFPSM